MASGDTTVKMQKEIAGKAFIITGSSSGIGRAVAFGFGMLGAKIVFNGRSKSRLDAAVKAARARGIDAVGIRADVTSAREVKHLMDRAFTFFGHIDVLINNAGVSGPAPAPFWQLKPSDASRVIETNLTGAMLCSSYYVRRLHLNKLAGRIVNVSSTAAARAYEGLAPYCASKFGLEGLTRTQALDLEGTGISVVCLEPESHRTPMTRRRLRPEDYTRLPPAGDVLRLFMYAVTAPAQFVQGRTLSEIRFGVDRDAEVRLNGPLAVIKPWLPYMPRYDHEPAYSSGSLNLDFLENPVGPSANAYDAVKNIDENFLVRYPDPRLTSLRHALARNLKIPPECFTFGNGSTELVDRILRTFAKPGESVVATDPTWPVFERFCDTHGIELVHVAYRVDRKKGLACLDLDKVLETTDSRTRLVYIVNPSNPLGSAIADADFTRFLERLSPHIAVVVDEAYIDYCVSSDIFRTHRHVLAIDRPLIGIRTFSKFFGLAGMRVGYAFAAPKTLDLIARLHHPFAVSGIAGELAAAALNDTEHSARTRDVIRRGRLHLRQALTRMGIFSLSSETNFVMAQVGIEPGTFYDTLAQENIFLPEVFWRGFAQLPVSFPRDHTRYLRVIAKLKGKRHA